MSLPRTFPAAILETVLSHLAALFLTGAGGDLNGARQAASQALAAYHPETETELRLTATIVGFGFHALEALGQATTEGMSLSRILRLRGSAVSLSRESQKAERRLDQLQQARRQSVQAQSQPEPAQPEAKTALTLPKDTPETTVAAKTNGLTWTQAYEQRQRDIRIAASLKRAEARVAAQSARDASPTHRQPPVAQSA
jgi:hypothetical protein